MDWTEFRRRMLRHCVWMAVMGQREYALWAAAQYEADSLGVLEGLHAKVLQVLEKREAASENRTSIPPGIAQPEPQERAALGGNTRSEG